MTQTADPGHEPVTCLKGVGPRLVETLARLGITRVQDLWFHLPLRYEDRTRVVPIRSLAAGERAQVEGVVEAVEKGFRFRPQLRIAISDDSGATLVLRFFHFRSAQAAQFVPGLRLRCFGEVRHGNQGLEIVHPSYQRIEAGAPVDAALSPVYPVVEGLTQQRIGALVTQALAMLPPDAQL